MQKLLRALWRRLHIRLNRVLLPLAARPFMRQSALPLEKLGTDYGGWIVPPGAIAADWVCWLAGVGEDISFDLALIARCGVQAHAFDFTPRAVRHVAKAAAGQSRFVFHPVGLWREDTHLQVWAPQDPKHVSYSALNLQGTQTSMEVNVRRPASLLKELRQSKLDLVKLDVEGAEYAVLDSMLADGLLPQVLCVEFDQPVPLWRTVAILWRLHRAGLRLVAVDAWNHTFVQRHLLAA